MLAKRLDEGGTIGVFCPSHVADKERYERIFYGIESLGYKVKIGENFYKDTFGYAASAEERAADLNGLVADPGVNMVLFSGGEGAAEVLPHIDYGLIRANPKLISSYSDATSILNAIHSKTGLVTYYGFGASQFDGISYYDYVQFNAHFAANHTADKFVKGGKWRTLKGGACEGVLVGGFTLLFALMMAGRYFNYDRDQKYILFVEDHINFSKPGMAGESLAFIEHSAFMGSVAGLVVGHYAETLPAEMLDCLTRFAERNHIPAVYTDDFGHGARHAVLPVGVRAALDADGQELAFIGYK